MDNMDIQDLMQLLSIA